MVIQTSINVEAPRQFSRCMLCGAWRDRFEIIVNFELCDDCFEMNCPCNDNHPNSCPLHRYPDVVLNFGSERR